MSTAVMTKRLELSSFADTAVKATARFWFAVTVVGQVVFGVTVASFYALTALRGDYHKWNFTNGYVPGVSMGNTAVVMHVASAAIRHARRGGSVGAANPQPLSSFSPLEWAYLHADRRHP